MTEAIKNYFTPVLAICSNQSDQQAEAYSLIKQQYGEIPAEQISVVNTDQGTLTIDMVRTLTQDLSYASFQGKLRHVVLLAADHSTVEAQNALLKLLEEPPAQTQLWLIATQPDRFLATIRSRCRDVVIESKNSEPSLDNTMTELATKIGTLSHRELSEIAEKHTDRDAAKNLLNQLINYYHQQLNKSSNIDYNHCLIILLDSSKYIEANVNVRLVIENCFFTLKQTLSYNRDH